MWVIELQTQAERRINGHEKYWKLRTKLDAGKNIMKTLGG